MVYGNDLANDPVEHAFESKQFEVKRQFVSPDPSARRV